MNQEKRIRLIERINGLGGIDWDQPSRRFVCPCHDSTFSLEGKMLSGPSPRDMDELALELQGEEVKVAYRRFRVGTPNKEEV